MIFSTISVLLSIIFFPMSQNKAFYSLHLFYIWRQY